jgi:hypothetical protein
VSPTNEGEQAEAGEEQGAAEDEPTPTVTHRPGEGPGESDDPPHPATTDRSWGWRGDVLLAVMFVSLIVAPLVVFLRPPAIEWRVRLLILPMLPGLLLAAVAVWATTRP